jgi:oligopeptidase B
LWATSHDGAKVPISVLRTKDSDKREKKLLHLYGYGSYGICKDPAFDSKLFSLLSRGFVYAIAHPRGSAVMGRTWYSIVIIIIIIIQSSLHNRYLDGKFEKKMNTFRDFIACADELVKQGYTTPEHSMFLVVDEWARY